jgi:hypothetical protein
MRKYVLSGFLPTFQMSGFLPTFIEGRYVRPWSLNQSYLCGRGFVLVVSVRRCCRVREVAGSNPGLD